MKILGIETSFDETGVAIVENGTTIVSNTLASSAQLHKKYGGVVPEIAARKQVELMIPILTETLTSHFPLPTSQIDAIAVTVGPGLIGSLLIGVETAKTLALLWNKPLIPVNHIHAHVYANFVNSQPTTDNLQQKITFPAISLVASGGHTELFYMKNAQSIKWLGGTLDDAAGECFDKIARLLGFENQGGPAIAATAAKFEIRNSKLEIKFPRPYLPDQPYNFSFSGLKTAVLREWKKYENHSEELIQAFAYETQEAITDVLVKKTVNAAIKHGAKSIFLSGGVAANKRLREKFSILNSQFSIRAPDGALCTDNAAAIAACAFFQNKPVDWKTITAQPNLTVK